MRKKRREKKGKVWLNETKDLKRMKGGRESCEQNDRDKNKMILLQGI